MKSLKAKRIAAVAASVLVGLAFAGQGVTFGNIPIINSQGQPVVQIVVGSQAAPSDGVVAANIAAVIGNLAFTSTNVTATVSGTSNLKCVISTPTCTLTNQQVYLGESGLASSSSSYVFSALIGSVLNRAVSLDTLQSTKSLQTGNQYAFQESDSLTASPSASPYTAAGYVPFSTVTATNNGGGVSFPGFTSSGYDNILQVTNANLPSLLNNYGSNGESEVLWVTGFPVYDQQNSVHQFQLISAGGAYQVVFNTPIQNRTSSNGVNINSPIMLLGKGWTILQAWGAGKTTSVTSSTAVAGGKLKLASSLTPLTTLYVGQNMTTGPFTVVLQDLGQPNTNGVSPASVAVYTNGKLTNETAIAPGNANITKFNVSGQTLYLEVNQTFAGLYAYQKWAKIQAYSNIMNVTSGHVFNQTSDPGWYTELLWTNTTATGGSSNAAMALKSIVVYNTTPVNLNAGQSFSFIQNPSEYKLTFVGSTLSSSNYDPVTATSSYQGSIQYQNLGAQAAFGPTNITEPAQVLTVTSSIPGAFSYAGQTGSSVMYDLTPYELATATGSGVTANAATIYGQNVISEVQLTFPNSNFVSSSNPLTLTVSGYPITGTSTIGASQITEQAQFTTAGTTQTVDLTSPLYNVTAIKLSRALPGALTANVVSYESANTANTLTLGSLTNAQVSGADTGYLLYGPQSGKVYYSVSTATAGNAVIYNQQNGQPTSNFQLTVQTPAVSAAVSQYGYFSMNEVAVPTNTAAQDQLNFGIYNSTGGVNANPLFQLNDSATLTSPAFTGGARNNMTYVSTTDTPMNVNQGFVTERGSVVQTISPTSVTVNFAKSVGMLQFIASASNATVANTTTHVVGPIGIGQSVPGLANVTIENVTASCRVGASAGNCTVSGVSNLTAVPSVTQAVTPVKLNTATTPLAVVDTNANSASTLIVVGSKYVNSVAAQVFAQNPSLNSSFGPSSVVVQAFGGSRILVAGYTANQTVQAGNQFIQDLLSASSA